MHIPSTNSFKFESLENDPKMHLPYANTASISK